MTIGETDRVAFVRAYIECALWSSTDNTREDGGEPLDENYGSEDLSPETREAMERECNEFLAASGAVISEAQAGKYLGGKDIEADRWGIAGHDFWLTRNGHGAGFADGHWDAKAERLLAMAARLRGEVDLYVGDDGQIWQTPLAKRV